jgi:hypothetical protein
MLEKDFQKGLIKELKSRYQGCIIQKGDAGRTQGIPDLIILYNDKWATLEVKASAKATHRPNQDLRVERMNKMSFSAFIFPENKEEVLHELDGHFARSLSTESTSMA